MYEQTRNGNWIKVPDTSFKQKPLHLAVLAAIRKRFGYEAMAHRFGQ